VSPAYLKWLFLVTVMFSSIADAVLPSGRTGGGTVAEVIVFSIIMFLWVREDARRRNVNLSPLLKVGVVALGAIFVPVYMIRSRGFRSASRSMAIFAAQFFGCLVATVIVLTVLQMTGLTKMRN